MDPTGSKGGEALNDDDDEYNPAQTTVYTFVAKSLHNIGNEKIWKLIQQD